MRHTSREAWELGAPPLKRLEASVPGPEHGALMLPGYLDGLDVSEFQWGIEYEKVAKAGFRFAVVRASLGVGYVDRMAARHAQGFRDAGLRVLFYGAMRPQEKDFRGQARRAIEGIGPTYARLMLDLETRGGLGNGTLLDGAREWLDEVDQLGALAPGLYSYPWFEQSLNPELSLGLDLGERPLWQAFIDGKEPWLPSWGSRPRVPSPPWQRETLWQYGGDGGYKVPGVPGACDRDLFRGTLDDLDRFLGLPVAPVDSAADTQPAPLVGDIDVTYDPFEDETPTKK